MHMIYGVPNSFHLVHVKIIMGILCKTSTKCQSTYGAQAKRHRSALCDALPDKESAERW